MANAFWKRIENAIHTGVHKVTDIFNTSEAEAVKLATTAAHYLEENGGKVLRDAATAAVLSAETVSGGSATKLSSAIAAVTAVLVAEGIPLIKSAINLAIEMALADAKEAGLIDDSAPAA